MPGKLSALIRLPSNLDCCSQVGRNWCARLNHPYLDTLPSLIINVSLPLPEADEPVFLMVTVHGPLPRSRVELSPMLLSVLDEHLIRISCDLLSLLTSLTLANADVLKNMAPITHGKKYRFMLFLLVSSNGRTCNPQRDLPV